MSKTLVAVDFDFFCYRNPRWPYAFPADVPVSAEDWKQRVGYTYYATGQNLRAKANIVAELDGVPQIQPGQFVDALQNRNVRLSEETKLYGGEYRRFSYSAAWKVKQTTGQPVDLIHFGTTHGFRAPNPLNKSADPTCADSWHWFAVKHGLFSSVTLVFPEWQRKFCEIDALMPDESCLARLPDGHPPIRGMFWNDWRGPSAPVHTDVFYAARDGAIVPPWLDDDYLRFVATVPSPTIKAIGDDCDPTPKDPRGWTETPPDDSQIEMMRTAPKIQDVLPDPDGVSVLYNGQVRTIY